MYSLAWWHITDCGHMKICVNISDLFAAWVKHAKLLHMLVNIIISPREADAEGKIEQKCKFHTTCTKDWFDWLQVRLPLTWGVTHTPGDAEWWHYLQLFQSYMTLLVCQRADCICQERTERDRGQLERLRYLILTINPTKHENHSNAKADKAVTVEELLMWPVRLHYKLQIYYFLDITQCFLRGFMHW